MPTRPASAARRPRICSAIARTSSSGSGSEAAMALRIVEEALQYERGRERVDIGARSAARAHLAQARLRGGGGERLVDHDHWCRVARREPARELFAQRGDRVLGTVGDRKSTRLNSSHTVISYAVFCLK